MKPLYGSVCLSVRSHAPTIAWACLGFGLAAGACLPPSSITGFLVAMSYDGHVEHLGLLTSGFRVVLGIGGLSALALAVPRWRSWVMRRVLPVSGAGLPPATLPGQHRPLAFSLAAVALSLLTAPAIIALVAVPAWQHPLLREDGVYENIQAACYLLGSGLFAAALIMRVRTRPSRTLGSAILLALVILALLAGLEEASYAQRFFRFDTPTALDQLNTQHEFNLHNVATGLLNRIGALAAVTLGLFLPVATLLWPRLAGAFRHYLTVLPEGAAILPFAFAALWTTPSDAAKARVDEQQCLAALVCVLFVVLLAVSLMHPPFRRAALPLLITSALLILTKATTELCHDHWLGHNYAEEVKELLIPVGVVGYALNWLSAIRRERRDLRHIPTPPATTANHN